MTIRSEPGSGTADGSASDRSGLPGGGQSWDASNYGTHARFVSDLGAGVVDLLAPMAGERILDLGCGDGALTEELGKRGADVVGIDASPQMIEAARARGLNAHVVDAMALPAVLDAGDDALPPGSFDAVFSNAALHWMTRPEPVVAGVHRLLKPGGRFAGEFGGAGNVAAIVGALNDELAARNTDPVNPWYYPTVEAYRAILEAAGFQVESAVLFDRPTALPTDMAGWLQTFAGAFLAALPADDRAGYLAAVVERLRPRLCDAAGAWTADYRRLRFRAVKAT